MKWFQNLIILAAGIPILIAGLLVVAALFLGAAGVVVAQRLRSASAA